MSEGQKATFGTCYELDFSFVLHNILSKIPLQTTILQMFTFLSVLPKSFQSCSD